jgi:hypothetical protein
LIKTTANTDENVEKVQQLVYTNRGMQIRMTAEELSLSNFNHQFQNKKGFAMMVPNCSIHCNICEAISGAKMDPSV